MKSFNYCGRWVCAVACLLSLWACGDDDGSKPKGDAGPNMDSGTPGNKDAGADSGMDASTSTGNGDSSVPPPPPPLMCGGDPCMISSGAAMLGTTACCTTDDKCGGMSALSAECLPLGAPGSYDESCPAFMLNAGFPLNFTGCCTAAGECGALDSSTGGFGCIPDSALPATDGGGIGQSCNYDPAATCTSILTAYCDGPEDCSGGQQCCATFAGRGYASFTCEDSCVELAAAGGIWSEVCHPGQTCDQPLPTDGGMAPMTAPDGGVIPYKCLSSAMYLPDFWYRCRDTGTEPTTAGSTASGEINCGDSTCGSGQKCCYALGAGAAITDGTAHCVAADAPCTCLPSGGEADGG